MKRFGNPAKRRAVVRVGLAWAMAAGQVTAQTSPPPGRPARQRTAVAPVSGRARPAPGLVAYVYPVPTAGEASRFQVPQVRLPDAAVARRINRRLLRFALAGEFEAVDSTVSPQRQLAQAVRECCYDADEKVWMAAGQGLTSCHYQVLFNQGGLLSLAVAVEFTGAYSWERSQYITLDLRTGHLLTLADVVTDPPAHLSQRLRWAINRRLGDELAGLRKYDRNDTATIAYVAERFEWDWTTHQSKSADLGLGDPVEFALTPRRLLLFYRVGFPHAALNLEPDDTYRFAYHTLHLRPRLRAALTGPPPAPNE